jgi:DNA/RNA-binding domain of Phe-tRNA-synthetase-like protein
MLCDGHLGPCQNPLVLFRYSDQILDVFPTTRGGIIHATGLSNGPTPPDLLDIYRAEQQRIRDAIGDTPLADVPSLAGWRRTFTAFGVKPTQYRNAAEALLRRLTKQGSIPSINMLVDVANLVSLRYQLPVAAFDQKAVTGGTTVQFAVGHERFTDLGSDVVTHPDPGEVVFADQAELVSARRWCWRQSDQSAVRATTVDALITVEGQHEDAEADVRRATDDLVQLLAEHQPRCAVESTLLSPHGSDPTQTR